MVDTIFLAELRALPFAGLGEQMPPRDVAVLLALEAVIESRIARPVVEAPDQAVADGKSGQQRQEALGDAEGHVGACDVAPFGQDLAAAIDDAGMSAPRADRSQHLVV